AVRLELALRAVKRRVAAPADVGPRFFVVEILAGKRALGSFVENDALFFRRQFIVLPVIFGFAHSLRKTCREKREKEYRDPSHPRPPPAWRSAAGIIGAGDRGAIHRCLFSATYHDSLQNARRDWQLADRLPVFPGARPSGRSAGPAPRDFARSAGLCQSSSRIAC